MPDQPSPSGIERVVLLGFMCSGKSTVGESLARRLGWDFLDFDVEIEAREGKPVSAIVEEGGEDYFRELEARLTSEMAERAFVVMAPGGGWVTRPELLRGIRRGTFSAWLRVTPRETVRRLREDDIDRPFKSHPDPQGMIEEMISEREPLFRMADVTIPTDGRQVEAVAFEIEQILRTRGC
jgi:shikimate kinase